MMKKISYLLLTVFVMFGSIESTIWARGFYGGGHYHSGGYSRGGWVAPFVFGGLLGYSLSRPNVIYTSPGVIYTSPAVIVNDAPPVVVQSSTILQDIPQVQTSYQGSIQAPLYEERWVYFEDCKCQKKVLVKISQ